MAFEGALGERERELAFAHPKTTKHGREKPQFEGDHDSRIVSDEQKKVTNRREREREREKIRNHKQKTSCSKKQRMERSQMEVRRQDTIKKIQSPNDAENETWQQTRTFIQKDHLDRIFFFKMTPNM